MPQWGALIGATTRQQQRSRSTFAKARCKQRRLWHGSHQHIGNFVWADEQLFDWQSINGFGQAQDDAIVAPHGFDGNAQSLEQAAFDGNRPRCMHGCAERRVNADAPVADFVAKTFDHDGAVGGQRASGLHLFVDIHEQIFGREWVEAMALDQHVFGTSRWLHLFVANRAQKLANCLPKFNRATKSVAVPERHLAWLAWCRVDNDTIKRHVFNSPS